MKTKRWKESKQRNWNIFRLRGVVATLKEVKSKQENFNITMDLNNAIAFTENIVNNLNNKIERLK